LRRVVAYLAGGAGVCATARPSLHKGKRHMLMDMGIEAVYRVDIEIGWEKKL
jgi:hypothetical protein